MASGPTEFDLLQPPAVGSGKLPRLVVEGVFAFPPNRNTMGGTAYLVVEPTGNILVDCPAWDETNVAFLQEQGGVRWLLLTHRAAHAHVREWNNALHCEILIQEQEAYLLPGIPVTPFSDEFQISSTSCALWTPGYSPGSSCLYHALQGGLLFTGRHLLPNQAGDPVPLRVSKTFHWPRQLRSLERLQREFSSETLQWICPGANTGFLRGKRAIDQAYERLGQLDVESLRSMQPGL
ncbi:MULTISPECIES: MBL fold metallo-hydrolase [unclassified Leptolyngbya]|uniref:MBL fold metallo-hydrolase n=1 Tax=unclassified Leptolyngbya TaxID=2650499 RepID=UPI00168A24CD|nr:MULTISPECIES: MBL fold metallo-hydrolase [unclassified Leptolyngbya]MBD1911982.1 MBL fold metallo-hydrolase [Leptolyngbya sp. FACHB-8]MBD2155352.1 MBL fold metallo-hydrolase [Leptolyngbya sp. FACHB-16]